MTNEGDTGGAAPIFARLRPELESLRAYRVPADPPPIKLDANESPWPLSGEARETMAQAVRELDLHRYPDGRAMELRQRLSQRLSRADHRVDDDSLLLGVGSDEVITILMNAFHTGKAGAPPSVAFPSPTFVMYGVTSKGHGMRPLPVPLDDAFALDETAFAAALGEHKPSLAFYATPNNPTGRCAPPEVLRRLIAAFPDTLHVIDEAYGPFDKTQAGESEQTLRHWTAEFANVAIMGTLSKVGLAGLRIGYVHAAPHLIAELEKVRQPFNLNAPAIAIANALLRDHGDEINAAIDAVVTERARVFDALAAMKRQPIPSRANFHLVRLGESEASAMREAGIAVRVFKDAALQGWARISVGTPDENTQLLSVLKSL